MSVWLCMYTICLCHKLLASSAQLEMHTHTVICTAHMQYAINAVNNSMLTIPPGRGTLYVHVEFHKLYVTSTTCLYEQALFKCITCILMCMPMNVHVYVCTQEV